ncbi:GNAT family N-acetyltransferase [Francisella philomiragia]|uniref:GNAT family N-acetyltransferase n=1 Tax=Francisella philomiragia TaxID=28110 RepID=UPI0035133AB3
MYNLEKKHEWDLFVKNAKNSHFMFYRDYMEYHSDRFDDMSLMFYDDKNNLSALFPANKRNNVLCSHQGLTFGGFIIGKDMKQKKLLDCFELLKEFANKESLVKVVYKALPTIYHQIPSQEDLYGLFINDANLVRLDSSSCLDLSENFKLPKGRKASISKARRESVYIEESNDFSAFIELENKVLQSQHNSQAVHSGEELSLLKERFPENIKLYVAKTKENLLVAGALLFIWKDIVHTQYLANDFVGRELGALDLLIKELIDEYRNKCYKYFNFGISNEDSGRYLNEGLVAQKESFGARTIVFSQYEIKV